MDELSIELLSVKYVDQVYELQKKLLGNVDIDEIKGTIQSDKLKYYLLLKDDKMIGFFECLVIAPEIELYDIVVDKQYQGCGYSKIMMDYLISLAKKFECDTIYLEVNNINNIAINLYKQYGFYKYSERKKYYGNNDAVLMKLDI